MRILAVAATILIPSFALATVPLPHLNQGHDLTKRNKTSCATGTDNWGNCVERDRTFTTIRASANDVDDISAELLYGLKRANNGGLLYLEKGKTYVIGKRLDLSFLHDVYVKLDGELKFTNDIKFWQKPANYFYYHFQKSITWVVWGGKDIKIYGTGTMNGNGQAWYDGFAGREILVYPGLSELFQLGFG